MKIIPYDFSGKILEPEKELSHLPNKLKPFFGVIYILQLSKSSIRIGATVNPHERIKTHINTLKIYSDRKIKKIYITPSHTNYQENKTKLRRLFIKKKIAGEIFKVSLAEVIKCLSDFQYKDESELLHRRSEAFLNDMKNVLFGIQKGGKMENLIPYNYLGKTIRLVVDESDRPWWIGEDVCVALGFSEYSDVLSNLDSEERMTVYVDTFGRNQAMTAVNGPGLYRLLSRSNKEHAKEFQRWIFHDVSPNIRGTGSNSIQHQPLQIAMEELRELIFEEEEYEVLKPTPDVADRIAAWKGPVCINVCAKILQISPHTFSASIVRDKYCFRRLGKIVPYSQYEKRGWFSRELVRAGGSGHTYRQTFITPLGVYRFMEIYNPHQPPESAFLIVKKHQADFQTDIDSIEQLHNANLKELIDIGMEFVKGKLQLTNEKMQILYDQTILVGNRVKDINEVMTTPCICTPSNYAEIRETLEKAFQACDREEWISCRSALEIFFEWEANQDLNYLDVSAWDYKHICRWLEMLYKTDLLNEPEGSPARTFYRLSFDQFISRMPEHVKPDFEKGLKKFFPKQHHMFKNSKIYTEDGKKGITIAEAAEAFGMSVDEITDALSDKDSGKFLLTEDETYTLQ